MRLQLWVDLSGETGQDRIVELVGGGERFLYLRHG